MPGGWEKQTPIERFAAKIRALEDAVAAMRGGLYIPFVDADPDASYGNIWAFQDGRIRIRLPDGTVKQITTATDTGTVSTVPLPAPVPQTQSFQQTWQAAWTESYQQGGASRGSAVLYWGKSDDFNGVQTSLVGLPYASIQAALAGASITKVEVFLHALHTGYPSGATVQFRGQANQAPPATLGGVGSLVLASTSVVGVDVGGVPTWHNVSKALGDALANGSALGFSLSASDAGLAQYGEVAGIASGVPAPALRVTYVK
jgi:hypothetical protein